MSRQARIGLVTAGILAVLGLPGAVRPVQAGDAGHLLVIDGDTLSRDGEVVQLSDIDAPELGQQCLDGDALYQCGLRAAYELEKLLTLEPVTCTPGTEPDRGYDCRTPDGSLSQKLVEEGLVTALPGSSLSAAEDRARRVPLGIWRGRFVTPEDWRRGVRLTEERADGGRCPIIGIERDGERLYVVPTDVGYDSLARDGQAESERFCSDEVARAEGYAHLTGPFRPS